MNTITDLTNDEQQTTIGGGGESPTTTPYKRLVDIPEMPDWPMPFPMPYGPCPAEY